ncbi:ESX secretion-associated protein EspG [Actinokineospora sp.]|uniref:ESX secretion-associated protein EspG n=1 Tax=Actinokineospora sp. TaxID=1872133 RepID=UPI0040384B26
MPVETLDRVLRAEGVGELPLVLAPPPGWRPRAENGALDTRARAECARLGWLDRLGRLDVEVAASLRVLCHADVAFFGWLSDGTRTIGVLTGAIGREAVLAIKDGDTVWLDRTPAVKLAATLVAQAPDVPPGRGGAVRVSQGDLLATTPDGSRRSDSGVGHRRASVEARAVRARTELAETGSGELYAALRDPVGRRTGIGVHYVDTVQGRYVTEVVDGPDGRHVLVSPVSRSDLVRRLRTATRTG